MIKLAVRFTLNHGLGHLVALWVFYLIEIVVRLYLFNWLLCQVSLTLDCKLGYRLSLLILHSSWVTDLITLFVVRYSKLLVHARSVRFPAKHGSIGGVYLCETLHARSRDSLARAMLLAELHQLGSADEVEAQFGEKLLLLLALEALFRYVTCDEIDNLVFIIASQAVIFQHYEEFLQAFLHQHGHRVDLA